MCQGATLSITLCSITCPSLGSHSVSITVTTLVMMLTKVTADCEGNCVKHLYTFCGKIPIFLTLLSVGQHINQYVSNTQHLQTHSNFICHAINAQIASFNSVTFLHSFVPKLGTAQWQIIRGNRVRVLITIRSTQI